MLNATCELSGGLLRYHSGIAICFLANECSDHGSLCARGKDKPDERALRFPVPEQISTYLDFIQSLLYLLSALQLQSQLKRMPGGMIWRRANCKEEKYLHCHKFSHFLLLSFSFSTVESDLELETRYKVFGMSFWDDFELWIHFFGVKLL